MKNRTTTQTTESKQLQQWYSKLYAHKREVTLNLGCFIDALRFKARVHDVDKLKGPKGHRMRERHHWLDRQVEDMNFLDLLETVADCVAVGHKFDRHIFVPIRPDLQTNDVLIDLIYNTVWSLITLRYPQSRKEDWTIEVGVKEISD